MMRNILIAFLIPVLILVLSPWISKDYAQEEAIKTFENEQRNSICDLLCPKVTVIGVKAIQRIPFGYIAEVEYKEEIYNIKTATNTRKYFISFFGEAYNYQRWWNQFTARRLPKVPLKIEITPVQTEPVVIMISKQEYFHDQNIFEPVKFTIRNIGPKTIYFQSGCAVSLPLIFKVEIDEEGKNNLRDLPTLEICQAVPTVVELKPGEDKLYFWDQKAPGDTLVKEGKYKLGVKYFYHNGSEMAFRAYSSQFSIKRVTWDKNQQKEICNSYGEGFSTDGGSFYSTKDCLSRLTLE